MDSVSLPALGVAGGSLTALVTILVWLIRRQASGQWYSAAQVKTLLDEKDKTITLYQTLAREWQGAHATLAITHTETTTALAQSIAANRSSERLWDVLIGKADKSPQAGDNGTQTREAQP